MKWSVIVAMCLIIVGLNSSVYSQLPNVDNGTTKSSLGVDDLCYDQEAIGDFDVYILCPLNLTAISSTDIDLGFINPDGARGLQNETMEWEVKGASSWIIEAYCANDVHSNESNNVYFAGAFWTYMPKGGSLQQLVLSEIPYGSCEYSVHSDRLQLGGGVLLPGRLNINGTNACEGFGYFTFHPNMVVANEKARKGKYTWDVFLSVDYMTFDTPVNVDGNPITSNK